MDNRTVSVVTCLWNNMEYWDLFYSSLKRLSARIDELIVVDNGSEDDTARILEQCPDVTFVRLEENLFEGGGVRCAMKKATGDLVFKCDPDIEFTSNEWQEQMIEMLDKGEEIGGVVCEPYFWHRCKHNEYQEASVLIGTLFLLERKVLDACGYWDAALKYGTNEFDYAVRMRREGFRIAIADFIPINHFVNHARLREIGTFDVGPLIQESWRALFEKLGTMEYWEIDVNTRFNGEWDRASKPPEV